MKGGTHWSNCGSWQAFQSSICLQESTRSWKRKKCLNIQGMQFRYEQADIHGVFQFLLHCYLLHTANIYTPVLAIWEMKQQEGKGSAFHWSMRIKVRCFNILSDWFTSTILCKSLPFHILVSLPVRKDCNIFSFHKDAACIHAYV